MPIPFATSIVLLRLVIYNVAQVISAFDSNEYNHVGLQLGFEGFGINGFD